MATHKFGIGARSTSQGASTAPSANAYDLELRALAASLPSSLSGGLGISFSGARS